VERWLRAPAPASAPRIVERGWDAALDRRAFGADRGRLLATLASGDCGSIAGSGYAMGRPGSSAAYFGPCVAVDSGATRILLEWFLARHSGELVYWDLLPENQDAVRLALDCGFERTRQLVRMARKGAGARPLTTSVREVYAIAGLEFG
jgi:hypothetical protein